MKCHCVRNKVILPLCILIGTISLLGSCSSPKSEGFAIYLTKDDVPPSQMEALSHVLLADQPFIGEDDIISYNRQSYEMKLSPGAFERISLLEVPTSGKYFLVCVDKNPVYWGAFWTKMSSQSFDGVTIWTRAEPYIVIELGYPSSSFHDGEDPRNKPEIIDALKKAGKLIDVLTISDIESMPKSMKGYELYSWLEEDGWHFTLITGTNRNKTLEEIVAGDEQISESGWVNIHSIGTEEIKMVLGKVPSGEFVSWCDGAFISGGSKFTRPPQEMIDDIRDYAIAQGLELTIKDS